MVVMGGATPHRLHVGKRPLCWILYMLYLHAKGTAAEVGWETDCCHATPSTREGPSPPRPLHASCTLHYPCVVCCVL